TGGLTWQRFRPPREAASPSSLGCRSIRSRLLLPCPAGQGGLPRRARRARGRSRVLRRRGVFPQRLLHGARRLSHRSGRCRPSDRRSPGETVVVTGGTTCPRRTTPPVAIFSQSDLPRHSRRCSAPAAHVSP